MAALFREAFEGRVEGEDHTWFVEGREAILPTLEGLNAFAASRKPGHDLPTLAAHAYHLRYILHWLNVPAGDAPPEGDWESTWTKTAVTDEEWAALLREIRVRYARALAWLAANEDWSVEDAALQYLAPLPHVAYHLGAMRAILKIIA